MAYLDKDWYQSSLICESLRGINLGMNLILMVMSVSHYYIRYRNAIYEGVEFVIEKEKPDGFFYS